MEDDTGETDFDDWKPGKSKPSPREFRGEPARVEQESGRPDGIRILRDDEERAFKTNAFRQCVVVVVLFALLSTYFSGSAARKERKRMENVTVTASSSSSLASPSSASSPRRAGSGSAHASIGFATPRVRRERKGREADTTWQIPRSC